MTKTSLEAAIEEFDRKGCVSDPDYKDDDKEEFYIKVGSVRTLIKAAQASLREPLGNEGWRPIESAKPLKKGMMRVYSFKPSSFRQGSTAKCDMLPRAFQFSSGMGYRECDLYIDIPSPPSTKPEEKG